MGVHLNRCNDENCRHEQFQYHSCGNRHCPNCGGTKRERWIADKTAELSDKTRKAMETPPAPVTPTGEIKSETAVNPTELSKIETVEDWKKQTGG